MTNPTVGRLAVVQLCSKINVTANIETARTAVTQAAAAGASFVCLPEAADYLGGPRQKKLALAQPLSGTTVASYCSLARANNVWLSFGVHESCSDSDTRYYNTHVVADSKGVIRGVYRKLHLFDACGIRESDTTIPGSQVVLVRDTPVGTIGLTTCYDVRFPCLYQVLARAGADVVLVPSAFLPVTGKAHWEVLLRARAVENGFWVAGAAQVGAHDEKLSTYGHSLVVDPWGDVMCDLGTDIGAVGLVHIDPQRTQQVRQRLPLHMHRRDDVLCNPDVKCVDKIESDC